MVPVTVLPEVDYLLTERLGPHVAIFALQTVAGPDFQIESIGTR
jgi:hypothetical protein